LFMVATAWLQLLDGVLAMNLASAPSLHACLLVHLGLNCRLAAVPGLMLLAAVARTPWSGVDLWSHLTGLALVGCCLLPQRRWFFRAGVLYRTLLGPAVVCMLFAVAWMYAMLDGHAEVGGTGSWSILSTALISAPVVALMQRLPPFSCFADMDPV
jgi:hypothetical protein